MQRASTGESRHVLKLLDIHEEFDHVYMRMEMCLGDLIQHCNSSPGQRLAERDAMMFTRQTCLGLQCVHRVGFLHRDVKPDNLLIARDMTIRIADFGWSAPLQPPPEDLAGTFDYLPPEVLSRVGPQTEAVDVWGAALSLLHTYIGGCIMQQPPALPATIPHDEAVKARLDHFLAEIQRLFPLSPAGRPPHVSHLAWDLYRQMLVPDFRGRASLDFCLSHGWLQLGNVLCLPGGGLPAREASRLTT